jgi:CYTH domain-containing protein
MSEYVETERRFFVDGRNARPWRDCERQSEIAQYYLDSSLFKRNGNDLGYAEAFALVQMNDEERTLFEATEDWTSRIRFTQDSATLTLKGKRAHASATELEWNISREVGDEIVSSKQHPSITKTRYHWKGKDGMIWEVDEFEGGLAGLVLAEIGVPHIDYDVVLPEWLGVELTGLHQWSNSTLALTEIS